MKTFILGITHQEAVNIGLQIICIILPWIYSFIKNKNFERYLKCKKVKSSLDRYINYYIFWYAAWFILIIVYILIEVIFYSLVGAFCTLDKFNKICYILFGLGVYVCAAIKLNKEEDTII